MRAFKLPVMVAVTALGLLALAAKADDFPPLNSTPTQDSFPGKFVWADLFTSNPAAAEKFYTQLFGWTSSTIQRTTSSGTHPYIILSNGDQAIGGIALRPQRLKDEIHGRWVGFVSVPDVGAAVSKATAGGAHVIFAPKELPQRGTQALVSDKEGALLGFLHSSSGDPGEYLPDMGDWTWAEYFSNDVPSASEFYKTVLGYDVTPDTRSDKPNHFVFVSGGYSRASLAPVPNHPKAHPTWLLFVRVANVTETIARVSGLGGKVILGPSDPSKEYWRAVIADPNGAAIGIVQLEDPAATKEAAP